MRSVSVILLISGLSCFGQDGKGSTRTYSELGLPYMQHYEPKTYNARPDNQAIVQGEDGIMYFGNSKGVLEFDGVSWRLIQLPNQGVIRTFAKTSDKRIYAGGFNDMGLLEADSTGFTNFRSIKSYLEEAYQDFTYVDYSFAISEEVYFTTEKFVFKWSGQEFDTWTRENGIRYACTVHGAVYVQDNDLTLYRLENEQFKMVKKLEHSVSALLPYGQNKMLITTVDSGIFLFDGKELTPFTTAVDPYLKEHLITRARLLHNGWIALGTHTGGLVVVDNAGVPVYVFDKDSGILDTNIYAISPDNQGGLWLGMAYGISRIELFSPFTLFDERMGIRSFIDAIGRHRDTLYAASADGLHYFDHNAGLTDRGFRTIPGFQMTFFLLENSNSLLVASRDGTYEVKNGLPKQIDPTPSGALSLSKLDSTILYIGLNDGFAFMRKTADHWTGFKEISAIRDDIRAIVEIDDGKLWLESQVDGVWLVDFYASGKFNSEQPVIKRFQANRELPPGWLFLHRFRGEAIFGIDGKVYHYDSELDSIVADTTFGDHFGFSGDINPKIEDSRGNLWMYVQFPDKEYDKMQRILARVQGDGSYEVSHIPNDRIIQNTKKALYPDGDTVVWAGGSDGVIVRQDLTMPLPEVKGFRAAIRKITINGDSVIFGGHGTFENNTSLNYENNSVRFEYAAASYNETEANNYQYFLEGYDREWSSWTRETKKDYTQIPEGNYTFRVRAKNIYQQRSAEDTYTLQIFPPWYRSRYAYLCYFLMIVLLVWTLIQFRNRSLKREKEALESLVKTRTQEVEEQSLQLKEQAEKLQELNSIKSRFFANISHEFRTPLTLIKGPVDELAQNPKENLSEENIGMIQRNTNRVLKLVNQLLELSKIDDGNLGIDAHEGDVYKCLRTAAASFNSHAAQRNIDYRIRIPLEVLWCSFDRDKLEKITYNLLANAFKFSGDGATICLKAGFDKQKLSLEISDTGKGIPREKLPFIFDRFYQTDNSAFNGEGGTGIGLSLSRELVEIMDGTITAKSKVDHGTTFTVQIPLKQIKTKSVSPANEIDSDPPYLHGMPSKKTFEPDNLNQPTILLVEDNRDMRHFIGEKLQKYYNLREAVNGEAGLISAQSQLPDLIITDLMMPMMDGLEFCKKLKTNILTSHIPVIMLTAKAGLENKLAGLETGADDYLTKPFVTDELLVRCRNLIDQRRRLREKYNGSGLQMNPAEITVTSVDQQFLEEILTLLEAHYTDPGFGVPQLQAALAMSRAQFHRKIKALTNETPGTLIRHFRLKRAAQLLAQKADSVTQVAYRVGFNNLSYFTKCFKELYGITPSGYDLKVHSS